MWKIGLMKVMQKPRLPPPTKTLMKTNKADIRRNLALRGKWTHSAATAQGLMFNAGHANSTGAAGIGASVKAVAGGGLIQKKKHLGEDEVGREN